MKSVHLSKSRYCSAIQCLKMLWLRTNKPECFDESCMNEAVLANGNMVGDLAMGLFGDFVEIPFGDLSDMIRWTEEEIQKGTPIIAEASFAVDDLFCSVDILRFVGPKDVEIYEVKSSTSLHPIYYHDVAYQTHVLSLCGFQVHRCCLVHLNSAYVREGDLDLNELFTIEDLTDQIYGMLPEVPKNIERIRAYMQQDEEPTDDIGPYCTDPYDCGYWGYCTRALPTPNVFDVARLQGKKKYQLYYDGIISFEALHTCGALSAAQYQQVDHEVLNLPPAVDAKSIQGFMKKLSFPLYFLDFESFQPPVPPYDGSRPYQQIVFQYSLHYLESEDGDLKHTEFLAYPGGDPRRALAEQLCQDIPLDVCTTAYNMSFEKTRIRELAELYPDLAAHLMNIHDHIVDLMVPFQKKWYYCKEMQGSYSIKYVLPALFPNDPELDYHNLEGVHNGGEASAAFGLMASMDSKALEKTRAQLLKYCGLDTYAMVKVWEKLRSI